MQTPKHPTEKKGGAGVRGLTRGMRVICGFLGMSLVLALFGMATSALPARRAASVPIMEAARAE